MIIELIVAHPDKASFNHAIAAACLTRLRANGHEVIFHDLYEERFDPLLKAGEYVRDAVLPDQIRRHCREISMAEGIVIVHPNWWGQPPAILKGWVDRVLRPGGAYEFLPGDKGEGVPRGLLKAGRALIFNTSNTEAARERGVFGDPLEALWKKCVFELCGVTIVERRMFSVVVTSTAQERNAWLSEAGETVNRIFPAVRSAPCVSETAS
jgi:NAD(P)H dehydrogenase (quinone)